MNPDDERFRRADSLLDATLDLPPAERDAFLDRECGDDQELRALVRRLLDHAEGAEDSAFLPPGGGLGTVDTSSPAGDGDLPESFGPYVIVQRVGEGGFGEVYMARQVRPVRRRVALKILKAGMDTRSVLARFEAESQALALMDHPNIARVYDAGETTRGRPFFAMEYVSGIPLTDYCDRQRFDVRDRLRIFLSICRAVQHAHSKGIIHRDLKPSNILVTVADGEAVPKVIDFGIAKASSQALTDKTIETLHGQLMGTPAYMSPEQVASDGLDVDTRTDIYSLGVVLYELLTGGLPLDGAGTESLEDLKQAILERDPEKPSTRAGRSATAGAEAASRSRTLRGDLDWITMKALEKDRTRRYETASAFAADIERFLADEPVEAGAPSAAYRARKFARRHRVAITAAAAVFLGVVVAAGGLAYSLVQSNRQRAATEAALRETESARASAVAVTKFLTDMLEASSPAEEGREVTVVELLDRAAASVGRDLAGDAAVEARVRETIGASYHALGKYDPAVNHLQRAAELDDGILGPDHVTTLDVRRQLATAHRDRGDLELAEALLRSLAADEARAGAPDSAVARTLDQLGSTLSLRGAYAEAESVQVLAVERAVAIFGRDDGRTGKIRANLGTLHRLQGRLEEARTELEEALVTLRGDWGPENPSTIVVETSLAGLHYQLGNYAEAAALMRSLLATESRVLGEDHPTTLGTLGDLAVVAGALGNAAESESLNVVSLQKRREVFGDDHPKTLQALNNLAAAHRRTGRYADAERLLLESLRRKRRVLGDDHRDTIITWANLGDLYVAWERPRAALPYLEDARAAAERSLPETHANRNDAVRKWAACLVALGRPAEAEEPLLEAHQRLLEQLGPEHLYTRRAVDALVALYEAKGDPEAAAEWRTRQPQGP